MVVVNPVVLWVVIGSYKEKIGGPLGGFCKSLSFLIQCIARYMSVDRVFAVYLDALRLALAPLPPHNINVHVNMLPTVVDSVSVRHLGILDPSP